MPQQHLPLQGPSAPIRGLRCTLDDGTLDLWDETLLTVEVRVGRDPFTAVWAKRLPGMQALYAGEIIDAATRAWPLAATFGDIVSACNAAHRRVKRAARLADA